MKTLNKHVVTPHFKMESLRSIRCLMQKGDWLLKLDLKDAYHSPRVPGISQIPVSGPILAISGLLWPELRSTHLHKASEACGSSIEEIGGQFDPLPRRHADTIENQGGSKTAPGIGLEAAGGLGVYHQSEQECDRTHSGAGLPGFKVDSRQMKISLPGHKLHALKKLVQRMLKLEKTSIQEIAQLLGTMVAAHPAILPAPLYYRNLESARSQALRRGVPYEAKVEVTPDMRADLDWWVSSSSQHNGRPLQVSRWISPGVQRTSELGRLPTVQSN